jgi:hypothetical protein
MRPSSCSLRPPFIRLEVHDPRELGEAVQQQVALLDHLLQSCARVNVESGRVAVSCQ